MKKCDDIEPGIRLVEETGRLSKNKRTENYNDHEESCGCHDHGHDEEHEYGHRHSHSEKKSFLSNAHDYSHEHGEGEKADLPVIIAGTVFFIIAKIAEGFTDNLWITAVLNIISYLILGGEILIDAAKGIVRGRIFSEKFLMSLATIAGKRC